MNSCKQLLDMAMLASAFAKKDYDKAKATASRLLQLGLVLGLILATLLGVGIHFGARLFTRDGGVLELISIGIPDRNWNWALGVSQELNVDMFIISAISWTLTSPLSFAHYGCVVVLLGCGGFLNEAKDFIISVSIEPDALVWRALLSASRLYADAEEAKSIFEKLVELELTNAGNYVLISNIYAATGLRSEVIQIRTQLKEKDLKKPPGISWIAVRRRVHYFMAGNRSHP
ncbi:hypothetical protein Ddye_022894 [Dipteronia dyeriana]|uniref:Uncharacterized protein n=1 Tax=Dipteronia dyeriana TaxID=168575 RepID=A0AAD9WRV5_9ROSI|nr:hypothetical protein Ddye_022894 [Dipteronia dyeriana]